MSFDESQQIDDNETNLAELFRSIWFYKFSLLAFIVLSVPLSIMFTTILEPTYKAETVFEKPSNDSMQGSNSLTSNIDGLGFLSLLGGGPMVGGRDIFFSEIRSESFL